MDLKTQIESQQRIACEAAERAMQTNRPGDNKRAEHMKQQAAWFIELYNVREIYKKYEKGHISESQMVQQLRNALKGEK